MVDTIIIDDVNELLHKIFGFDDLSLKKHSFTGERFLKGEYIDKHDTQSLLSQLEPEQLNSLHSILKFYYPRWITYNLLIHLEDNNFELYAENQLLLGITSIIDNLANSSDERVNYTKRFEEFLRKNLSGDEIEQFINLFKNKSLYEAKELKDLNSLKAITKYIYDTRSEVVHRTGSKSIYPFKIYYKNSGKTNVITHVVTPSTFRHSLWKAILNHFGLQIIQFP